MDTLVHHFHERLSNHLNNDCITMQINELKTDQRRVFRLLDLPRELRDQIYDAVFEGCHISFCLVAMDVDALYGDAGHQPGEKFPTLLLANSQVLVEAMEQFYRRMRIRFSPWSFASTRLNSSLLIDPTKARYVSIYGEVTNPSSEGKATKLVAKFSDETMTITRKLMDWLKLQRSVSWEELDIHVFGRSEIRKLKLDMSILEPLSTTTNLKKIHFIAEDQFGRDFAFIGPHRWEKEFSRLGWAIVGGNGAVRKWVSVDNETSLLYDHVEVKKV